MDFDRRRRDFEVEETGGVGLAPAPAQFGGNADRCGALGLADGGWADVGQERDATGWFDGVDAAHGATSTTQKFDALVRPGLGAKLSCGASLVVGVGGENALDVAVTNLGNGILKLECGVGVAAKVGLGAGAGETGGEASAGAGVELRRTFEVPWPALVTDWAAVAKLVMSCTVFANELVEGLVSSVIAGVDLNPYVVADEVKLVGSGEAEGELGAFVGPEIEGLVELSSAFGVAVTYDGTPDADGFRTGEVALSVDEEGAGELSGALAKSWGLNASVPAQAGASFAVVIGFEEHFDTKVFTSAAIRVSVEGRVGDVGGAFESQTGTEGSTAKLSFTFPLTAPIATLPALLVEKEGVGGAGGRVSGTCTMVLTVPMPSTDGEHALAEALARVAQTGSLDAVPPELRAEVTALFDACTVAVAMDVVVELGGDLDLGVGSVEGQAEWSYHEDDVQDKLEAPITWQQVLDAVTA